jgi:hypothetical protein
MDLQTRRYCAEALVGEWWFLCVALPRGIWQPANVVIVGWFVRGVGGGVNE